MEDTILLARVPLFTSLDPGNLAELAGKLVTRHYRRGETIFHKDDPGSTLYIVKSGKVKITTLSPEGEELILALLADGEFFGELSLLDGRPRSASAVAMEETRALMLHRDDLLSIIAKRPELISNIMIALGDLVRHATILLEDATFYDLPARLAKRLLELGERHGIKTERGLEIDLRLTQQDLANAVGSSREAVNKQLSLFQDRGLISNDKGRFTIHRPDELRKRIY